MTPKEKKQLSKRLRKSDKALWDTLTEAERDLAVEKYYAITDPLKLSPADLIESVWNRADNVMVIVMGVVLGISGGLVANVLDRYFSKYGMPYDIAVVALFAIVVFGFTKLSELVVIVGYRDGKLLDRLVERHDTGKR